MSYGTVLGVTPGERPVKLAELRNAHGWAPSIWRRLLRAHGYDENWVSTFRGDDAGRGLTWLWQNIDSLPEWQQAPLILTFDTGIVPRQAFEWAADKLEEFEKGMPSPENHVNHVPAVVELLRSKPDVPLIGVWGTSVTDNPFDPWDSEADAPGSGIPLSEMFVLKRHQSLIVELFGGSSSGSDHGGAPPESRG